MFLFICITIQSTSFSRRLFSFWALILYPCLHSMHPVNSVLYRSFHIHSDISALIISLCLRLRTCFNVVLLSQLTVSSFGFIHWRNSEFQQAGIALIFLLADLMIFFAFAKLISFVSIAGPKWYNAKALYNTCSKTVVIFVVREKPNVLIFNIFFLMQFFIFFIRSDLLYEIQVPRYLMLFWCLANLSSSWYFLWR